MVSQSEIEVKTHAEVPEGTPDDTSRSNERVGNAQDGPYSHPRGMGNPTPPSGSRTEPARISRTFDARYVGERSLEGQRSGRENLASAQTPFGRRAARVGATPLSPAFLKLLASKRADRSKEIKRKFVI